MVKKLIVIPAHNEESTILDVLGKAREIDDWDTLLIDCASTDRTLEKARAVFPNQKYVSTNVKGLAVNLVNAFNIGIMRGYDYIATCDGDSEYDVTEVPHLYESMTPDVYCVVGNRFTQKQPPIKDQVLSQIVKDLYSREINDCKSGERVYNAQKLIQVLQHPFQATHYGLSLELIMKGLSKGQTIIQQDLTHYQKKRERVLLDVNNQNKEVVDLLKILGEGKVIDGQNRLFHACLELGVDFDQWKAEFDKGNEYLIGGANGK